MGLVAGDEHSDVGTRHEELRHALRTLHLQQEETHEDCSSDNRVTRREKAKQRRKITPNKAEMRRKHRFGWNAGERRTECLVIALSTGCIVIAATAVDLSQFEI